MDDDYSYLCELGPLNHEPIRPPRPNHLGEEVFAAAWKIQMDEMVDHWGGPCGHGAPNSRLAMILHHLPERLNQRHATVAASLVPWFGTNCGASFIQQARHEAETNPRPESWLRTWAEENVRRGWLNSGFRTLEHCLAPADHMGPGGIKRLPALSAIDLEVAEHVVSWLGSGQGAKFLATCEAEIASRRQEEHRQLLHRLARPADPADQSPDDKQELATAGPSPFQPPGQSQQEVGRV